MRILADDRTHRWVQEMMMSTTTICFPLPPHGGAPYSDELSDFGFEVLDIVLDRSTRRLLRGLEFDSGLWGWLEGGDNPNFAFKREVAGLERDALIAGGDLKLARVTLPSEIADELFQPGDGRLATTWDQRKPPADLCFGLPVVISGPGERTPSPLVTCSWPTRRASRVVWQADTADLWIPALVDWLSDLWGHAIHQAIRHGDLDDLRELLELEQARMSGWRESAVDARVAVDLTSPESLSDNYVFGWDVVDYAQSWVSALDEELDVAEAALGEGHPAVAAVAELLPVTTVVDARRIVRARAALTDAMWAMEHGSERLKRITRAGMLGSSQKILALEKIERHAGWLALSDLSDGLFAQVNKLHEGDLRNPDEATLDLIEFARSVVDGGIDDTSPAFITVSIRRPGSDPKSGHDVATVKGRAILGRLKLADGSRAVICGPDLVNELAIAVLDAALAEGYLMKSPRDLEALGRIVRCAEALAERAREAGHSALASQATTAARSLRAAEAWLLHGVADEAEAFLRARGREPGGAA